MRIELRQLRPDGEAELRVTLAQNCKRFQDVETAPDEKTALLLMPRCRENEMNFLGFAVTLVLLPFFGKLDARLLPVYKRGWLPGILHSRNLLQRIIRISVSDHPFPISCLGSFPDTLCGLPQSPRQGVVGPPWYCRCFAPTVFRGPDRSRDARQVHLCVNRDDLRGVS